MASKVVEVQVVVVVLEAFPSSVHAYMAEDQEEEDVDEEEEEGDAKMEEVGAQTVTTS